MDNYEVFQLLQELEKNIADEAEAREGYYKILGRYGHLLTIEEGYTFREILAEELKHSKLLKEMIERRNGIFAER